MCKPKVPKVTPPAAPPPPPVDLPVRFEKAVTQDQRKASGSARSVLRIDRSVNTGSGGTGVNVGI